MSIIQSNPSFVYMPARAMSSNQVLPVGIASAQPADSLPKPSDSYIRNATMVSAGLGIVTAFFYVRHIIRLAPRMGVPNPLALMGIPMLMVAGSGILGGFIGAYLQKRANSHHARS